MGWRPRNLKRGYDPKTGIFSVAGSKTTARAYHTAALLADGRVLSAGGFNYA